MKILVGVKRVVDFNVNIRVKSDGSGVDIANAKMSINPFDEVAVEQAVRLREQGIANEVIVVTVGPDKAVDTLRTALAMGADRAILVQTDVNTEPLAVAKVLAAIARAEQPSLVLVGKQAIDDDCNQTGQMLAGLLDWSQAVSSSAIEQRDGELRIGREIDEGIETIDVRLPAVVTVDLRLNDPRHASLPDIMKARKKPVDMTTPQALGVDVTPRLIAIEVRSPEQRAAGIRVETIDALALAIHTALEAN